MSFDTRSRRAQAPTETYTLTLTSFLFTDYKDADTSGMLRPRPRSATAFW